MNEDDVDSQREDGGDQARGAPALGGGPQFLLHRQLMGKRVYMQSQIRFFVAGGIVVSALAGKFLFSIEGLDVPALVGLAALLAAFNGVVFTVARRCRQAGHEASACRFITGLMHLTISVDFVFLTVALWLVGGVKSPFRAFYFLHVMLASVLLSPRAAWAHALFGYCLLSGLVLGQWSGLIPMRFPAGLVNSVQPLDGRFALTVLAVQGLLMALAVFLMTGLAQLLRQGERHLRDANSELERLSGLQRDFLHITVHDLKTPVSAAMMLLDAAQVAADPPLPDRHVYLLQRVQTRLNEALGFLRDFEVLADLDTANIQRQGADVDVAAMVRSVVEEHEDLAQSRGQALRTDLAEGLPPVFGIGRLLHEAIANLVTNAIKYTPGNGIIVARALRKNSSVRIEVEDNGIGIAPEEQKLLFREFVRLQRTSSTGESIKGSGLGLSIVRRIVSAGGGTVGVVSQPGKGSTFFIELPAQDDPRTNTG
jgi:signal transduction histidine kinase